MEALPDNVFISFHVTLNPLVGNHIRVALSEIIPPWRAIYQSVADVLWKKVEPFEAISLKSLSEAETLVEKHYIPTTVAAPITANRGVSSPMVGRALKLFELTQRLSFATLLTTRGLLSSKTGELPPPFQLRTRLAQFFGLSFVGVRKVSEALSQGASSVTLFAANLDTLIGSHLSFPNGVGHPMLLPPVPLDESPFDRGSVDAVVKLFPHERVGQWAAAVEHDRLVGREDHLLLVLLLNLSPTHDFFQHSISLLLPCMISILRTEGKRSFCLHCCT